MSLVSQVFQLSHPYALSQGWALTRVVLQCKLLAGWKASTKQKINMGDEEGTAIDSARHCPKQCPWRST